MRVLLLPSSPGSSLCHCGDGAGAKGKGDRDQREKEEAEGREKDREREREREELSCYLFLKRYYFQYECPIFRTSNIIIS